MKKFIPWIIIFWFLPAICFAGGITRVLPAVDSAQIDEWGFFHTSGGTMTGNIIMSDDGWIGVSEDSIRLVFDTTEHDVVKFLGGHVAIGDAPVPDSAALTILSAMAHQFRLAYSAASWFDFECDPDGNIQIRTTGGEVSFTDENIKTSGYVTVGSVIAGPDSQLTVYGGAHVSKNVRIEGDIAIEGDDITMGTNTSGYILRADGSNYSPVALTQSSDLAGFLSDETGSGVAVFGTSPSFTTSINIPNETNPTTDAVGEIAWDSDDSGLELYDSTYDVSILLPVLDDKEAVITKPDEMGIEDIPLFHVDIDKYPHGIKLINVQWGQSSAVSDTFVLHEYSTISTFASTIDSVVSSATYAEETTITDSDIAADAWIFADVANCDVDWIFIKIIFYVKEGD